MIESGSDSVIQPVLRYGMIGGGRGSFIGDVHRKAIGLDGRARIAAGCFSRDFVNTNETGRRLEISADRLYRTYEEMAEAEAGRNDGIDFIVIVTPNSGHFGAAEAFLERGIHVVCDKPLTLTVAEAEKLARLAEKNGLLFCVTYTYTGYPAVKHAREMVRHGDIGDIRFVNAEYAQDWLATPVENEGNKQAEWRTDPARTGESNCVGDIGSHIENLVSCITGLRIESVSARLDSFVPGRVLDDNASILVEYEGGVKGLYWSSQIAIGFNNAIRIRVFGTKGSIVWEQENPDSLTVARLGEPVETLSRGRDGFYPSAQAYSRIPAGHPEGYIEAFANIYRGFTRALSCVKSGSTDGLPDFDFPSVEAGVDGVRFIAACVESSRNGNAWTTVRSR